MISCTYDSCMIFTYWTHGYRRWFWRSTPARTRSLSPGWPRVDFCAGPECSALTNGDFGGCALGRSGSMPPSDRLNPPPTVVVACCGRAEAIAHHRSCVELVVCRRAPSFASASHHVPLRCRTATRRPLSPGRAVSMPAEHLLRTLAIEKERYEDAPEALQAARDRAVTWLGEREGVGRSSDST